MEIQAKWMPMVSWISRTFSDSKLWITKWIIDCYLISYQLSAISYQLPATSYQLSAISYQLPAISMKLIFKNAYHTKPLSLGITHVSRLTLHETQLTTHNSQLTTHNSRLTSHD